MKAVSGSVFELHAGGSSSSNLNATSGNDRRSDIVKPSVDVSGQVGPGTTWFDTTAFAPVTDLNRFGTSPFYLLHGPGLFHIDLPLACNFRSTERVGPPVPRSKTRSGLLMRGRKMEEYLADLSAKAESDMTSQLAVVMSLTGQLISSLYQVSRSCTS